MRTDTDRNLEKFNLTIINFVIVFILKLLVTLVKKAS